MICGVSGYLDQNIKRKKNKKIFHDKFKDVKTVLVLDKDKKKIRYFDNFLKQNNFRLSSNIIYLCMKPLI